MESAIRSVAGRVAGTRGVLLVEAFVLLNFGGLAGDVLLAHAANSYAHPIEWVPVVFSAIALALLVWGFAGRLRGRQRLDRITGLAVGGLAVLVGVAGMVWHLESRFFRELTLHSLVYAAPFAAPLAYTGLGLLLLLDRMVDDASAEWPRWVLLLAWGGFVGNFVFALTDHAQNGFFHATEWIPVVSSALAVGTLAIPLFAPLAEPLDGGYRRFSYGVLALQAAVGVLGFVLHWGAIFRGPHPTLMGNVVSGAPAFAPLLLPDLAILAWLALASWREEDN